jgi:putative membrane protein
MAIVRLRPLLLATVLGVGAVVAVPVAASAHDVSPRPAANRGGDTAPAPLNDQDHTFADGAAHGAAAEIATGGLALGRGRSFWTRLYGWAMVSQHSVEAGDLRATAGRIGVTLPEGLDQDQQDTLQNLAALPAGAFDCGYATHEVQDHEKDIADYQDEIDKGANPQLQAFATRWLPVLHVHLDWARQLSTGLGCGS